MFKKVRRHAITGYRTGARTSADPWADEAYKREYHAFTSLAWSPNEKKLYCGLTNFGNDLLWEFDPADGGFKDLGYRKAGFGDPFDIKLHRSLEIDSRGVLYGATSCLHGIERRAEGPGGKVFSYDPAAGQYRLLAIPKSRDYIQTISLDEKRGMIYGFTYPVFEFFAYSIGENRVRYCEYQESIVHVGAVDDRGRYWGTWSSRHQLFSYDPAENRVTYHRHGFPETFHSLMYPNAGPVDAMINGGDGFIYAATENATLYRLDPESGRLEYLGKPYPGCRMPGLQAAADGLIYGCGGSDDQPVVFRYDRRSGRFETLGEIRDSADGEVCFRTHDLEVVGDTIYVGETDNPNRTNYLWECRL